MKNAERLYRSAAAQLLQIAAELTEIIAALNPASKPPEAPEKPVE